MLSFRIVCIIQNCFSAYGPFNLYTGVQNQKRMKIWPYTLLQNRPLLLLQHWLYCITSKEILAGDANLLASDANLLASDANLLASDANTASAAEMV